MKWLSQILRRFVLTPEEQVRLKHGRLLNAEEMRRVHEGVVLTPEQKTLLDADRATVLRAMLSPEQWQLLEALEKPATFLADVTFEPNEADALEQFFRSPLWAKVDVAVINWTQQQAQKAIGAAPEQMVAAGKFAYGCRAGFEMTKSISRLAAAKRSEPEDTDATTAAAGLEQHQP